MRPKLSLIYVLMLMSLTLHAQQSQVFTVDFYPVFGNQPLVLDSQQYSLKVGDTVSVSTFRFYISHIKLNRKGKIKWLEPDSYHLIDAAATGSLTVKLDIPKGLRFDEIVFDLGVDSTASASGAMGGDLDPMYGMYWAWQSGYINFKAEGTGNRCRSRKHEFQFHLGGYLSPFACLQEVTLKIPSRKRVSIAVDLGRFLTAVDLSSLNHIMSPSAQAVALSKVAASIFSVRKP